MTDRHGKTGKTDAGDQAVVTSRFNVKAESVEDAARIDALVRELLERELGKGGDAPEDGGEPEPEKAAGKLPREVRLMRTRFLQCMNEAMYELEEGRPTHALLAVDEAVDLAEDALDAMVQVFGLDDRTAAGIAAAAGCAYLARYSLKEGTVERVPAMCTEAAVATLRAFAAADL